MADLGHGGAVLPRQPERRLRGRRPSDKKADGLELCQARQSRARLRLGYRQWGNVIGRLSRDAQRLAARGDYPHLRTGLQQMPGRLGAGGEQVLAIVEDDEQLPVPDVMSERGYNGLALLFL